MGEVPYSAPRRTDCRFSMDARGNHLALTADGQVGRLEGGWYVHGCPGQPPHPHGRRTGGRVGRGTVRAWMPGATTSPSRQTNRWAGWEGDGTCMNARGNHFALTADEQVGGLGGGRYGRVDRVDECRRMGAV